MNVSRYVCYEGMSALLKHSDTHGWPIKAAVASRYELMSVSDQARCSL